MTFEIYQIISQDNFLFWTKFFKRITFALQTVDPKKDWLLSSWCKLHCKHQSWTNSVYIISGTHFIQKFKAFGRLFHDSCVAAFLVYCCHQLWRRRETSICPCFTFGSSEEKPMTDKWTRSLSLSAADRWCSAWILHQKTRKPRVAW